MRRIAAAIILMLASTYVRTHALAAQSESFLQCNLVTSEVEIFAPTGHTPNVSRLKNILKNLAPYFATTDSAVSPKIQVIAWSQPTAVAVYPNHIIISTGTLSTITDDDELAFIIAHEAAHLALHHGIKATKSQTQEFEADDLAVSWIVHSPNDALPAFRALSTFKKRRCSSDISTSLCAEAAGRLDRLKTYLRS